MLRIGGFGALFGGAMWFVGLAASSGIAFAEGGRMWLGVMALGSVCILVALVGLSAFQGRRQPRLAWVAFGVPALATILSAVGATGMLLLPEDGALFGQWSPWGIWIIGLMGMFVGSILFAVATYQADVLSRRAAMALGAASVAAVVLAFGTAGRNNPESVGIVLLAVMGSFAGSWMWLGFSALRRGPIRAVVAEA